VLGVGRGHAYRSVKDGDIPAIRLGSRMLVRTAALRQMIGPELLQGTSAAR